MINECRTDGVAGMTQWGDGQFDHFARRVKSTFNQHGEKERYGSTELIHGVSYAAEERTIAATTLLNSLKSTIQIDVTDRGSDNCDVGTENQRLDGTVPTPYVQVNLMESLRRRRGEIPATLTRRTEEGNRLCQEQWQNDRTRASDQPSGITKKRS